MADDEVHLQHIAEHIAVIRRYLADADNVAPEIAIPSDTMTEDAVFRRMSLVTRSAQKLAPSVRARYPEAQWQELNELHDALMHGYLHPDTFRVWRMIAAQLPALDRFVTEELRRRFVRE